MIRTKGEAGTGDVVQAVRNMHRMNSGISKIISMREESSVRRTSKAHAKGHFAKKF